MKDLIQVIGMFILIVAVVILTGWVVAWSWNVTMPYIFGLPYINFAHGIALMVLSAMLFMPPSKKE